MKKFKEVIRAAAERDKAFTKKPIHQILFSRGFDRHAIDVKLRDEDGTHPFSVYISLRTNATFNRTYYDYTGYSRRGSDNTRAILADLRNEYAPAQYSRISDDLHYFIRPETFARYACRGLIVLVSERHESDVKLIIVDENIISRTEERYYARELDRRYLYSRESFYYWRSA